MRRYALILALAMMLAALLVMPAFSQEAKDTAAQEKAPAEAIAPPVTSPEAAQPKDISIYGEVLAVNAQAKTMSVQYYDYDSDEEKTVEISVTADTKLENAAGLNDVKKGDWVDATYTAAAGKNTAKSVMVEKEEAPATETAAPAAEAPAAPAAPAKQ